MRAAALCLVPARPTRVDLAVTLSTVQALLRLELKDRFAFVVNQCPPGRSLRASEAAAELGAFGVLAEPPIAAPSAVAPSGSNRTPATASPATASPEGSKGARSVNRARRTPAPMMTAPRSNRLDHSQRVVRAHPRFKVHIAE